MTDDHMYLQWEGGGWGEAGTQVCSLFGVRYLPIKCAAHKGRSSFFSYAFWRHHHRQPQRVCFHDDSKSKSS